MGGRAHPEFRALTVAAGDSAPRRGSWAANEDVRPLWRRVLPIALVAAATLACIVTLLITGGSGLEGTAWRLVAWSEPSIDPAGFTITASFDDGRVSGTAAVNSYSGECAVGGITFSPGAIARTEMAGPPEAMEAEALYFELLGQAETYVTDGDVLTIQGASGSALLVFERAE